MLALFADNSNTNERNISTKTINTALELRYFGASASMCPNQTVQTNVITTACAVKLPRGDFQSLCQDRTKSCGIPQGCNKNRPN